MDQMGMSKGKVRKEIKKIREESVPMLDEYNHHLEVLGERSSYSKTDPDATFMRMKEDAMNNGQIKPGYNVQTSTENQFITYYGIYWRPTDAGTMIDFLESFEGRYGRKNKGIVADFGYESEQNYEYMLDNGMVPYVKYNMFHKEQTRKYKDNPFLPANMYYNKDEDYYVCPIRGMCYKGKNDRRIIEVNHKANGYREKARELLNSEKGLHHRSNRPIEPEVVFGNIKFNHGFKRFKLKSHRKVIVEWGPVAIAHNLRKYIAQKLKQDDKVVNIEANNSNILLNIAA